MNKSGIGPIFLLFIGVLMLFSGGTILFLHPFDLTITILAIALPICVMLAGIVLHFLRRE